MRGPCLARGKHLTNVSLLLLLLQKSWGQWRCWPSFSVTGKCHGAAIFNCLVMAAWVQS